MTNLDVSRIRLLLASDVTPFQLAHELTGSRLTVSPHPAGGFLVHWISNEISRPAFPARDSPLHRRQHETLPAPSPVRQRRASPQLRHAARAQIDCEDVAQGEWTTAQGQGAGNPGMAQAQETVRCGMNSIPQSSSRFALIDGKHYAFDYWLRGKWRRGWRFGENQADANKRAIEFFQYLGGGNVQVIRRADTEEIIWERGSNQSKESVNGTDQAG